jgi:cell division protein FtsW (lipid II flippase)
VRRLLRIALPVAVAVIALLVVPAAALAASGNDIGHNLGSLLRSTAAALYTGVVAIFALGFLINRKFTELVVFFCAALVVGWLVFAPGEVAEAAKVLAQRVLP